MTPPKAQEKRKEEVALQMEEMEKQLRTTEKLLNEAMQLWTTLEEDEKV
jgi:hypothetical protein